MLKIDNVDYRNKIVFIVYNDSVVLRCFISVVENNRFQVIKIDAEVNPTTGIHETKLVKTHIMFSSIHSIIIDQG